jgi:hypothetical protein
MLRRRILSWRYSSTPKTSAARHEDCRKTLDTAAISVIEPGQQWAVDVEYAEQCVTLDQWDDDLRL